MVFLDECTSGSDSIVRRDLWETTQIAKEGCVIFLITLSIAEAQYIAGHNRIGIMAKGRLRVMGNALHLKTKYGAGHSLVVVMESQDNVSALLYSMQSIFASAMLNESSESSSATGSNMAGGSTETVASFSLPIAYGTPEAFLSQQSSESSSCSRVTRMCTELATIRWTRPRWTRFSSRSRRSVKMSGRR